MSADHPLEVRALHAPLSIELEPIVTAASRGQYELLIAEIERSASRLLPGSLPRMIFYVGGGWREWSAVGEDAESPPILLADDALSAKKTCQFDGHWFVPISTRAIALLIQSTEPGAVPDDRIEVLRQCAALAIQTCERQRLATQNLDEVQALQRVVTRMLKSHDLSEILLYITQESKRLLGADICGVMLREDDRVVMRRCVGNRSPETASLVMVEGQGLAGRVLEQRAPAAVADYLASDDISRDFFHLAEAEMVRSALAAPLIGRGGMIGVLEVWRRRPSVFTPLDTTRLVALANMTSIAIENAELYVRQAAMVEALERANEALEERYVVVRRISELTQQLMQALLTGADLAAIIVKAAGLQDMDMGAIAADGTVLAWSGADDQQPALRDVVHQLRSRRQRSGDGRDGETLDVGGTPWRSQPVVVEGESVAWIVGPIGPQAAEVATLTFTQVAMISALRRLEQRAASRARSESIDAIVWDLLRGEDLKRTAALDRAGELKFDLSGPLRVCLCEIGRSTSGLAEFSASELRQRINDALGDADVVRAVALRGNSVALLCADPGTDLIERFAHRLSSRLARELSGRRVVIGTSSRCAVPRALGTAYREAQIALDVGRQLDRTGAIVYDRAGVVGMLLSLRHEVGMRRFLELNLGALFEEEERQREMYLQTLRVFFDTNCSHEAASQHLGVHRKTVAHRLARIAELTGLDLSTHDDRLVADLCLYVYRLLNSGNGAFDDTADQ